MHYAIHNINVVAVIVAALGSFILGAIWYSPVLFANIWMKGLGMTKEAMTKVDRQKMMMYMATSFIQALVVAVAMAHFFNITRDAGDLTIGMAIETALFCWFAFVFMIALVHKNYEQANMTVFWVNVGYRFVEFIIIALIVYFIH